MEREPTPGSGVREGGPVAVAETGPCGTDLTRPGRRPRRYSEGPEPGSGRPADSVMNHTATPPTTAAAIM